MSNQKLSKLELYIGILRTLEKNQSLKLGDIHDITNVNNSLLMHAINFLQEQKLVEQKRSGKLVSFRNTTRGLRVARCLGEYQKRSRDSIQIKKEVAFRGLTSID